LYDGDGKRVKSNNDYVNLAAGISATSDGTLNWPLAATNGDTWADSGNGNDGEFAYINESGLHYVQIDLGAAYPVDKINVWHYNGDGRIYHQTSTQVSTDGITWTTVFTSTVSGEYPETDAGKTITFTSRNVRYVRDWLNGSTANAGNHWMEIEAWGRTTTTYIGNYYELTGGTVRTYYYAGGQRAAMRLNGTVYFLLSDLLGSTTSMVNTSGVKLTQIKCMPWGENQVYKSWGGSLNKNGSTPTTYRFTGQRSEEGLTEGRSIGR
jgi:hypothetical protein